ncbi:MAG: SUMF1/EgtB/PvdO family nonheme iron enzyme [Phycisphaerae bacterium]
MLSQTCARIALRACAVFALCILNSGCPTEDTTQTDVSGQTSNTGAPQAVSQTINVAFNTATAITLAANDASGSQSLTYALTSQPQHGVLTGAPPNVTYTPNDGFSGGDSFSFTASRGATTGPPATITLNVQSDQALTLDLGNGVTLALVRIAPGTFQMGDLSGVGFAAERPVHAVTISRAFYMGEFEVTQAQWTAVMGAWSFYRTGDQRPAEFVSWDDCQTFCQRVSQQTGRIVRLPTEAEWEFACRAGTSSDYFFGSDVSGIAGYVWYGGDSNTQTHEVGGKLPNAWGLYDMLGNVWEMCQDWNGTYSAAAATDPTGSATGSYRIIRGGSYSSSAGISGNDLRCSVRNEVDPAKARGADTGFRVVVEAP